MEIVHCINLDKREDRLLLIAKEAKRQGFALMLWNGIDEPSLGAVKKAICLSHKQIIRYAQQHRLPYVIIAEDDLMMFGEGAFQYWIDNKPKDFDLYCGTVFDGEVCPDTNRIKNGMSATMSLYMVHSRFYHVILNDIADDSHIDRSLGMLAHKYKYFVPPLLVCSQHQGFSDNRKQKTSDYSIYLQKRKLFGRD